MHLTINSEKIPDIVLNISKRLMENGHQAFIVGGAIRDSLLGLQAKDWDVATNAMPDRIRDLFPEMTSFNLKHGTVTLVSEGSHFEVTTFRGTEGFSSCIEEDLAHRDFTFNAMAYDIYQQKDYRPLRRPTRYRREDCPGSPQSIRTVSRGSFEDDKGYQVLFRAWICH
jgi:tRNA nucleotidyltransferase/poly(A) polymerase